MRILERNPTVTLNAMPLHLKLSALSGEDKDNIHQAAVRILAEIGMEIMHPATRQMLLAAGCEVKANGMVIIPEKLVGKAVASAPASIAVYDRQAQKVMDLGGQRSYFGTGSDLIFALDSQTGQRHQCVLEDVARAARVADALANIDFIMSFAHPSDYPARQAYLLSFQAMVENSTKPIVCTAASRRDLSAMRQVAEVLRGGEDSLRARPYFIHYAEPISPLKHPVDSLEKLLFCAEKAIPVIYSPAPIAGSTAPMTMAGHIAQGLAECFCGLVIHQLRAPGAPFIMGMGPAVLDMATGQCSYNAPEYLLAYLAIIEMSQYYDLPNWGYAGTSDSQIPDEQAVFEAGLLTFLSATAGSNLNHDVGYLDFGRTGSLEMIVILDEIIDQVRRLCRGIPVNEELLAVDVIGQVGSRGNFLTQEHTLRHLRATQWRPRLISRQGYENWEKSGCLSLLERAQKKLPQILRDHRPASLAEDQARKIQQRVAQFKN